MQTLDIRILPTTLIDWHCNTAMGNFASVHPKTMFRYIV
jgi:hypothetical protein